ncbi:tetratricopeptide repeat protein [Sphingobium nicotianae]|nr:tetratricopeptide repeat protein [Sphingobium nicotianae]
MLAAALALSASSTLGKKADVPVPNARAVQWTVKAQEALAAGNITQARDAYETALLLAPQDPGIYMALGKIARLQKMPGKAIRYFGRALEIDPDNQTALQGEGLAMMDKGATESARETLAKLRTICKQSCASAEPLVAAIAAGAPKVAAADKVPAPRMPEAN